MNRSCPLRLSLGQLGKRVGLARSSILHYEALGLLMPSERSAAGYRYYGNAELQRLRTIRRLREAGLPLADIRFMLALPQSSGHSQPPSPTDLLTRRLLGICREVDRLREQQRLLARLLATAGLREAHRRCNKAMWVALLREAGLDDAAMRQWHIEFEHDDPQEHAAFLMSLGLDEYEIQEIRGGYQRPSGATQDVG